MRAAESGSTRARPNSRDGRGTNVTTHNWTRPPRSAHPSPRNSPPTKGDLDITKYLVSSTPKSSVAVRVSAWGSSSSSPSHMADHLPSSLPPSTVRKFNSPKPRDEKVEMEAQRPQTRTGPRSDGRKKQVGSGLPASVALQHASLVFILLLTKSARGRLSKACNHGEHR
jgi:hypothetical protein